jgi:hypothetical protein
MPRGRRCRTLTANQIARLEKFRRAGDPNHRSGFSYPQLKLSMNGIFTLDTLMRALAGKPIWERYHAYIAEWLDRYAPEAPVIDGKALASGEKDEEAEATGTIREPMDGK